MVQEANPERNVFWSSCDARRGDECQERLVGFERGRFGVELAKSREECGCCGLAECWVVQCRELEGAPPVELE